MSASLLFHLARQVQWLRRASGSLRTNGWAGTWHRLRATLHAPTGSPGRTVDPTSGDLDGRPWILVVDDGVPAPDRDSGSLRLYNLMRTMLAAGYRVAFVPDAGPTGSADAARLRDAGIHVPCLRGAFDAPRWLRRHGASLAAAILCRHHVAGHWLPFVRAVAPRAMVVFDTVDLHFLRESREAALRGDAHLRRRAGATRARELRLVAQADVTWVVSPVERELLLEACPGREIHLVSNIIDEDTAGLPWAARRGLLFVGGMRHPPNRDAVAWLAGDIFPRVRAALPGVELHLVGSTEGGPAPAGDGIHCHGQVADIAPWLDGCRVALAPLRFGAGVKGKVNLSMAHGQPVVATGCAVEGMHLCPGSDVLVADDAAAFAAEVVRLYRDEALWQRLSDAGRDNVRRHFSPGAVLGALEASLGTPARLRSRC